ncbi:MAG: hypothetical protein Q8L22_04125 [Reyranella sp.]|nr:hypothetical protein [Reyranella sp.]
MGIGAALALTFAWDLEVPVKHFYETDYDLYRDFTEEYWNEKDEYDDDY